MAEVLPVEDRLRSFVCLLLQSAKLKVLEMTVSIVTCMDVGIEEHSHVRINQLIIEPILLSILKILLTSPSILNMKSSHCTSGLEQNTLYFGLKMGIYSRRKCG